MSAPTCACGRPVNGTVLCNGCKHTLDVALANIRAYHADLELVQTRAKAVRYDLPKGKGPGRSVPLPVDDRFLPAGPGAAALAEARSAVVTWVRVALEAWPPAPFEGRLLCTDSLCKRCSKIRFERKLRRHPADTVASCCAYLARLLDRIASAPWATSLMHDMLGAEKALKRVDARGPERVYAGLCTICLAVGDRTPMYAVVGEEWVTCPAEDCGLEYRVEDRRNQMRDALEYEWMTAAAIADLATYLQLLGDREWVRKKLNYWHRTGTLRPASVDDQGNPMFPFGEATRLLSAADATRRLRLKGA